MPLLRCPHCDSERIAAFVYGLPAHETMDAADRGEVILGGCDPSPFTAGCFECGSIWSDSNEPAGAISQTFAQYFANWHIRLPPGAEDLGGRGSIAKAGWTINYLVDRDENGKYLQFYATHRMTNDRRLRIYETGRMETLDAIVEMYGYNPQVPGAEQKAKQEYFEHNQRIADELRRLGLYPEGSINAYLRTHQYP